MTLTVRNDPKRFSGGHALLEGPGLAGVATLIVEDGHSGLFLAPDGRWAKQPHALGVSPASGDPPALALGPDIVDAIPTESYLKLSGGDGADLGSLLWVDILPSRSRRETAPSVLGLAPSPPSVELAPAPEPAPPRPPEPVPPLPVAAAALPSVPARPRRALLLPLLAVAVLGLGAFGLLTMRGRTSGPDRAVLPPTAAVDPCATFGGQAAQADLSDDERVKLAENALGAGCGTQAFGLLESADWETNEAVAWYLARFYDPNEPKAVFHQAAIPHPDWAASYYARWAARSPRQATALKTLCTTNGAAFDTNAQLNRACTR